MASDLTSGAYAGKKTVLYYDSAETWATPTWAEIARARNVQTTEGPALTEVEFHGTGKTTSITGYDSFSGSFEYVRKSGTDAVYAYLAAARAAGDTIHLAHLNGPVDETGPTGWKAPVVLGEFSETANGNDSVVVTIPFALADAYDGSNVQIGKTALAGSAA